MDAKNYVEVTRYQYGQMLSFPLSTFYLSWRHQSIQKFIMRGASLEVTLEQQGAEVEVVGRLLQVFRDDHSLCHTAADEG